MLKISIAQINSTVGDLEGNSQQILKSHRQAVSQKSDLLVVPELALCGYPPEDLLLKEHFIQQNIYVLQSLAKKIHSCAAIVGFVDSDASGQIYNAAAFIVEGRIKGVYHKQHLPNYGVFDEKRYFAPGVTDGIFELNGVRIGVNICEDIWIDKGVYLKQARQKAKLIVNISCSPYEAGKISLRSDLICKRAKEVGVPLVYVNAVGGQDELVFDGGSMMANAKGALIKRMRQFEPDLETIDLDNLKNDVKALLDPDEEIYHALVLGVRDYVHKNGFSKVALGLSGGVDSALVAVVAADALGAENVVGVCMPSAYNSKATMNDAKKLAENLGIEFRKIPIQHLFKAGLKSLKSSFVGQKPNSAEENIQARLRGILLMALSNKFGWLVLTTGNKSEMAVGYCTLYGDMNGGFAPLKDIFKTRVYSLCRWRNSVARDVLIPKSILLRAPSAELRPNQTDEEALGLYENLDQVLKQYIEEHKSIAQIANARLPLDYVRKTVRLVDINEYKRRQAPPGIKITLRAFGKDWRLPLTNKYHE